MQSVPLKFGKCTLLTAKHHWMLSWKIFYKLRFKSWRTSSKPITYNTYFMRVMDNCDLPVYSAALYAAFSIPLPSFSFHLLESAVVSSPAEEL